MAVDRVKPLKMENATDGTEVDLRPTETDPAEDYLAAKGIAFENLNTFLVEKLGRVITELEPDQTFAIASTGDVVNSVSIYNSATQIDANRVYRVDFSYTGDDITTEAHKIYDTDGTTVLRTITYSYTYSSGEITSGSVAVT